MYFSMAVTASTRENFTNEQKDLKQAGRMLMMIRSQWSSTVMCGEVTGHID
jgi:hypothetical protein